MDSYFSIGSATEGGYKEKGSKFLAYAFPVSDEAEIQTHLEHLKTVHYDARHHCYAWRLGPDGKQYRANDAGEPNHSAGTPILNEIRSRDLLDVLVVVVRYFGGTKLGIPGLIEAYGSSAADALDQAEKVEIVLREEISIRFSYPQTSEVGRVIQKFGLKPTMSSYAEDCRQKFAVRLRDSQELRQIFEEMGILTEE